MDPEDFPPIALYPYPMDAHLVEEFGWDTLDSEL